MFRSAVNRISELSQQAVVTDWLSDTLLTQAPVGKRQNAWLAGKVLLAQLTEQQPLPEMTVSRQGKPAFRDLHLPAFNISHSGDYVFVATVERGEIGCDLEVIREHPTCLAIAQHYFTPREYCWLTAQPPDLLSLSFWRLWTVREALLKQQGTSIWQMRNIVLDPETLRVSGSTVLHWDQAGLSLAVAYRSHSQHALSDEPVDPPG